jgi:hypothetical protein
MKHFDEREREYLSLRATRSAFYARRKTLRKSKLAGSAMGGSLRPGDLVTGPREAAGKAAGEVLGAARATGDFVVLG